MAVPAVDVKSRSTGRSAARARSAARTAPPQRRPRATSGTRSAAARPAPARRGVTPAGGVVAIPAAAVGGAAGAITGLADSGLFHGLTRGRLWIGLLGFLLGGIVALNVWGLSLSASATGTASKIDELERTNSVLGAKIAKRSSSQRVQAAADGLGLTTPTPTAVQYLKARSADAEKAAERLSAGKLPLLGAASAPAVPAPEDGAAATEPLAPVTGAEPLEAAPEPAPVAPVDPAAATDTGLAP